jgi:hypothetical protein
MGANHADDKETRRSQTGILLFGNRAPIHSETQNAPRASAAPTNFSPPQQQGGVRGTSIYSLSVKFSSVTRIYHELNGGNTASPQLGEHGINGMDSNSNTNWRKHFYHGNNMRRSRMKEVISTVDNTLNQEKALPRTLSWLNSI